MKKKNKKYAKYCMGNLWLLFLAAANICTLFLPYVVGNESVLPINFLNGSLGKITGVFSLMFIILKVLPALFSFVIQIYPADAIKKYVVTCFVSIWLSVGEVLSFVILMQRFEGSAGLGFIFGIILAVMILVFCFVFTKINKSPARHKEMVWYRGFNKIALLVLMPCATALTVGIIMFTSLVFKFPFMTALGIICLWASLVICSVVAVLTLYGKYRSGMLYYLVAFLSAVSIVSLCWSPNVVVMLAGVILASIAGIFCLMLGGVSKKYF